MAETSPTAAERKRERMRKWREANPDYQRQWYAANREAHLERSRKWGAVNRDRKRSGNSPVFADMALMTPLRRPCGKRSNASAICANATWTCFGRLSNTGTDVQPTSLKCQAAFANEAWRTKRATRSSDSWRTILISCAGWQTI
jgi:hypothetical protein